MIAALAPWLTDPYVWGGVAVAFMLAELALPGFLMLGFGLGALAMAVVIAISGLASLGALPLVLIWAAASLAAWFILSRLFGRRARRAGDRDINDFENH